MLAADPALGPQPLGSGGQQVTDRGPDAAPADSAGRPGAGRTADLGPPITAGDGSAGTESRAVPARRVGVGRLAAAMVSASRARRCLRGRGSVAASRRRERLGMSGR